MLTNQNIESIVTGGGVAYATDGEVLGAVREIYLDVQSGEPSLARIRTGMSNTADTGVAGKPSTKTAGTNISPTLLAHGIIRSDERLHVGTENVESGKVRLRKYVVTENVSATVLVSHEEVHVEREPITEANRSAAMTGGDLTQDVHEIALHEERAVVEKETIPVERVRLGTETVTEEQQVNEEVRKEQTDTNTSGDDQGKKR